MTATITATAAAAKPSVPPPTQAQIRAAVSRAERSHDLWATINVCKKQGDQDIIGIRGQMPSLGFTTQMSLIIQPEYWSHDAARFKPIPGDAKQVSLGSATRSVIQGGASFRFQPPAGTLRAAVTFQWRLGKKLLASTVRKTSHGHKHVDFADPPGYSAGVCALS